MHQDVQSSVTVLPRVDRGLVGRLREPLRQAAIFAAYFSQFIKTRLAYRVDFMIDLMANLVSMGVQLTVLSVLFSKIEALQGWSYEQVLFIYGFSLLPLGLFNLVSINLYRFSELYIIEGQFDRILLRPINPLAQVMFSSFGMGGLNEILLGIAVVVHASIKLGLVFGPLDVLALLLLAITASLVFMGVFLGLTAVSFWMEDRMGLAPPVYNIIRFSRYPVTIFNPMIRMILTFVLPFAWVAFYPATWFIGTGEFHRIAMLTPLVGIATFGLAYLIWSRGVKRYASTGT
jgi:viologen exporter family transport system permease protein